MVENTGKAVRADTYKPLNTPEALRVEEDSSGLPVAVKMKRRQAVISIKDRWRLDDEWWRAEPVLRLYYNILLDSGQHLVLYKDLITGGWYEQDLVALDAPDDWERMKEEYSVLSLFPEGHIMSRLRHRFNGGFCTSRDIDRLNGGAGVTAAGLVIRRQRPQGKVVYITLEDEFSHIPCMAFAKVYERYEHQFRSPFLIVRGRLTRREGMHNVVIQQVKPFSALEKAPQSKDWR